MTEDPLTSEQVRTLENRARTALVESTALAALAATSCVYPTLFLPEVTKGLKAVNTDDEGTMRVYAVDKAGEVRRGPNGPLTAADVVTELRQDHEWEDIGWPRRKRKQ